MAVSLDQFLENLTSSELLSAEQLERLLAGVDLRSTVAEETVKEQLVRRHGATPYQLSWLAKPTATPLVLGDYVLLEPLGQGGMGEVYRARHRHMHRMVALKVLPERALGSASAVARFRREVRAAARLEHPNVVTAYDAGEQRGICYLVMQLIDGQDLASVLHHYGPLPVVDAVNYVRQAAEGIASAHQRGVIHRDLKPGNLLLDSTGTIKVLDLGLARFALQEPSGEPHGDAVTEGDGVMGTVDYMAPEQAEDAHQADQRSDIYSLGCTLFRLLTGRRMYEQPTTVKKILAHRHDPIPKPSDFRSDVPPQLESIFDKMVAKRPQDRYASMKEVSDQLGMILDVLQASPDLAGERTSPWIAQPPPPPPQVGVETLVARGQGEVTLPAVAPPITPAAKEGVADRFRRRGSGQTPAALITAVVGGVCVLLLAAAVGMGIWLAGDSGDDVSQDNDGRNSFNTSQNRPGRNDEDDPLLSDALKEMQDNATDAKPVYRYPTVHQMLVGLIDPVRHRDEYRKLYTEIATCVEEGTSGRWLIGGGNTLDGKAHYLTTKNGEKRYKALEPDEIAAAKLLPDEFRHELPRDWRPPTELHLTLRPTRSEVVTYVDDRREVKIRFSHEGQVPGNCLELLAHLAYRSKDGETDLNTLVELTGRKMPASPAELTFRLPPEVDTNRTAKLYIEAYLPRPDARYWRISNTIAIPLGSFDVTISHGLDVRGIQEKLAAILPESADVSNGMLLMEVGAAVQSGRKLRWVIRGGSTRDGKPWEIVVDNGSWIARQAEDFQEEEGTAKGLSRYGDPLLGLPEKLLFHLGDARLTADKPDLAGETKIRGKLSAVALNDTAAERLALVYRCPTEVADRQLIDSYQLISAEANDTEQLELDLTLPPDLQPNSGGAFFLIGLVEDEDRQKRFYRLSNRLAWPESTHP